MFDDYRVENNGDSFVFMHIPTSKVLLTTQSVSLTTLHRLAEEHALGLPKGALIEMERV